MKGWCVVPAERMSAYDFVQPLSPYTNFFAHYEQRVLRNFSGDTQLFNRESAHHSGVLDYFSRGKTSAPPMGIAVTDP